MSKRKKILQDESGNVLIIVALGIFVILGFFAMGVEAGRWYLIRAELSKSVDAGALAGAKNLSNPHVDPLLVAQEFSQENFSAGTLGTPGAGAGAVSFQAQIVDEDQVKVDGQTYGLPVIAQLFGVENVSIGTLGVAQMKEAEIMMVLDRSGSMEGQPMEDLKVASKSFVDYFEDTQDRDRVGLISFATSVTVDRPMGSNFVDAINRSIDDMVADGATNPEDALDQAKGPLGFSDQSALPQGRRVHQFLIFFSDGRPTAFRGMFLNRGNLVDGVACVTGNCEPWDIGAGVRTFGQLGLPDREGWMPGIDPRFTGDGLAGASACGQITTRYMVFDTRPVPGYTRSACGIPWQNVLSGHICNLASTMAVEHVQELKDKGVTVYAIGLGTVNRGFLDQVATSPELAYYTPDSDQLQAIFQKVAKEIKLRMVQ